MPQAYTLTGPRQFELRAYELPDLGPHDVRLQSLISGISHGTELNLYRGGSPFASKHFDGAHRLFMPNDQQEHPVGRLGYEMVSRVVEVGSAVTSMHAGDLVHSATNHQPMTIVNLECDASGEIPLQVLDMPAERAIFCALAGVALVAIQDAQVKLGDHVVVFGLGVIGLLVAQMARLSGAAQVTAVDPIARRRELAAAYGVAETIDPTQADPAVVLKCTADHQVPDVIIEASGSYNGLQGALRAAPMGGTIVTLGYYQGPATPITLGEEWHHNRLTLISSMGVWGCPSRYYLMWDRRRVSRTAFNLLASGQLNVDGMITQRFPYDQMPQAFRLIDEHPDQVIKVVLTYPEG